jgi:cytidylate kinase
VDFDALKWDDNELVAVVFQDHETGEVLVLGYMNREALQKTLETGKAHLFRRSHGRVMMKGETSGNVQLVKEILVDCDGDALVMKIEQIGAACHEGYRSCFYRKLVGDRLAIVGERLFEPAARGGESAEHVVASAERVVEPEETLRPAKRRQRPCVAIDGPVAAGKSTIARRVAHELGFTYVDSGATYRGLAWAARRHGISSDDRSRLDDLLGELEIQLRPQPDGSNQVVVDGQDVTDEIRSPEIGKLASRLSAIPRVRRRMVALQKEMAREGGVVMEGRDIQTVVLPEAEVKIFLTAPTEERAERRWHELRARGISADLRQVQAEIEARDERDSTRSDSPLRAASDAVHVATGGMTIEQVVERVLEVVRERAATDPGPSQSSSV